MTPLLALCIVTFLDRQVINIPAEPIKRDLGLALLALFTLSEPRKGRRRHAGPDGYLIHTARVHVARDILRHASCGKA